MSILKLKIKFISWFHSKFPGKYCWGDCVAWAYSKRWNPFKISSARGCRQESIDHQCGACYCGGWNNGKCWDLLGEDEKEKIIMSRVQENKLEGIPF